jgi:hypothetical protein
MFNSLSGVVVAMSNPLLGDRVALFQAKKVRRQGA